MVLIQFVVPWLSKRIGSQIRTYSVPYSVQSRSILSIITIVVSA